MLGNFKLGKGKGVAEYYEEASELYDHDQYEKTVNTLDKAIAEDDSLYQLFYLKALALDRLERFEEAKTAFQEALKRNPDNMDALYNLARLYYDQEDVDVASAYIDQAREAMTEEGDPDVEYLSGLIWEAEGRNKEALGAWERSLALEPEQPLVYILMGRLYNTMKEYPKAIETLKKALEQDPNNIDVNYELTLCLAKVGNWNETLEYCRKVLELEPNHARAYNQMGLAYYCMEDLDNAVTNYKKALEIQPDYSSALNNLAYTYEKQHEFDKAIATFVRYLPYTEGEERQLVEEQIDVLRRKQQD